MFELDAERDLAAGELVGQHRHRASEHVRSGLAGRDCLQPSRCAGGVDVGDEGVEHLVAARDVGIVAEHGREQSVVAFGQLLGDDRGLGDGRGDPPVLDRQTGVVLALGGFDGRCSVVLDNRARGYFVNSPSRASSTNPRPARSRRYAACDVPDRLREDPGRDAKGRWVPSSC